MKKNKTRFLALVLSALMLGATACSKNEESKKDTEKPDSSSAVTTTTADDNKDSSEPEDSSETKQETPSDITPALWKLETESGKTVYFMGSMHALPESAYPFPEAIMNAYESSDAVAFECDTVAYMSDLNAQMEMAEMATYSDGTTIKDHIDAEIYKELVDKLKGWNLYMSAYDYFKPAMWQSIIDEYLLSKTGLDASKGFDTYFLNKCKEDNKEIIEVESVEFQLNMMFGFSDTINNLLMESYATTTTEEDYVSQLNDLYDAWSEGDIDKVAESDEIDESEFTEEEIAAYNDYNKQMLDDRNVTMANKLIELSKGDKNVFFIVGAAHYPGDKGILKLLDDAGVKYERIDY